MGQKIILSEREKKRISDLHTSRVLLEQGVVGPENKPDTKSWNAPMADDKKSVTQAEPIITTTTTTVPTAGPRYKKAVCPAGNPKCDQTTLRIQTRMNDECKELTPKLVEDGRIGSKTTSAWTMCKSKLTPTKVVAGAGVPAAGVPAAGVPAAGVPANGTGTPTTDTKMTPADLATLGFK